MNINPTENIIIGTSSPIVRMRQLISMVAPTSGTVLILGPTGAGKELVANAIHSESKRKGKLVALNCAAIPSELLESELFGYEKGAFTGADRLRIGRFEQAQGGTIFLDEIGDLPLPLQSKLLRVLETRIIQRVGGREDIKLDFRLVCATHQKISAKVESGDFREDLFYRLNVFPILVPKLAERREDITAIINSMLTDRTAESTNIRKTEFDESAMDALKAHDWPGNVRELRNVLDRALIVFSNSIVTGKNVRENLLHLSVPDLNSIEDQNTLWEAVGDLGETDGLASFGNIPTPEDFQNWFDENDCIDLRGFIRDLEVVLIKGALRKHGSSVSHAADALKIRRTTLIEKMKKLSIDKSASV